MTKNLLLLLSLIAISGSISAMQTSKELHEKLEQCLKNHKDKKKSATETCAPIKLKLLKSHEREDEEFQKCRKLLPKNFKLLDGICDGEKDDAKKVECVVFRALDLKLELTDLCFSYAHTLENENELYGRMSESKNKK